MIANIALLSQLTAGVLALHHRLDQNLDRDIMDCWDRGGIKPEAKIFHLHTPKAAGCSVVKDLSAIVGRDNVWSFETCFEMSNNPDFKALQDTVVMVRQPREHVYSQYQFCKAATDPGYHAIVSSHGGLPGQKNYHLATNFQNWTEQWTQSPRYGFYSIYEDYEQCYCPHNMQTQRLACQVTADVCQPTGDVDLAMENLHKATILGVTEAYHESVCLFHAHLLGVLPEYCNCENDGAWDSYATTKVTHGEEYEGSIEDMPQKTIDEVDAMTKQDKIIYQAGVKRFIEDVQKMEKRFGTRILCPSQLDMLNKKANY